MAKGHHEPAGENDYIEQLNWEANHRRRRSDSVHYEPNWKYKIIHSYPQITPFGRIVRAVVLLGLAGLIVFMTFWLTETLEGKIFYSAIFGLIIAIIFFAARDSKKDSDDDSKNVD